MRDTFVRTLVELAQDNHNIELITGDLGFEVLKPFWTLLPNQFINAGIAEQNMTSMAAGMALDGKIVFTYSIGNFPTLRCIEQIRNDCAYHNANVKIVCVGGGFAYGSLGMSHQATEDIAILRALPDVAIFAPGDAYETECITKAMVDYKGTCYLRLGRGGAKNIHTSPIDFKIGKAVRVQSGLRVAIFSTGAIFEEVIKVRDELEANGVRPTIYTFPTIKPLDSETILKCAEEHELIIACEEHNILGGFGGAVAEVMAENRTNARLIRIGINDEYCMHVGDQNFLRDKYGLSSSKITERILKELK